MNLKLRLGLNRDKILNLTEVLVSDYKPVVVVTVVKEILFIKYKTNSECGTAAEVIVNNCIGYLLQLMLGTEYFHVC